MSDKVKELIEVPQTWYKEGALVSFPLDRAFACLELTIVQNIVHLSLRKTITKRFD